ncbi:PREDICTED: uncharacterized protein LOC108609589 [Drosophila arizonae]|uniref:Uncharacterized protein LOC108609589 n=1 Tax=Drosophila arizonae TaxID=7263 RepID=A0ABM1NPB2_DROAR|nr:PREDICTED: uncharacterized protein LOC108609589 [Drosophila arizonae]
MDKFLNPSNKREATNEPSMPGADEAKKRKKTSEVWTHFDKCQNKIFAKCRLCGKEYKTSGNTSNLLEHLKRAHPVRSNESSNLNKIDQFFFPSMEKISSGATIDGFAALLESLQCLCSQPVLVRSDFAVRDSHEILR